MSELQKTDYRGSSPANLEDILPIAERGDNAAREYFASRCLIERYIESPVVLNLVKEVIRREFNPTALVACLPPRDELRSVRFKPGSFLDQFNEGVSTFHGCLDGGAPLRLRMMPEVCELSHLGIMTSGTVKAGLDAVNRLASAQDAPKFLPTDLRVVMLVENNRTVLEFEASLPPKVNSDCPLAILASCAARRALHLCLAAAIARVACNKLKIPDGVLKGILTEAAARLQEDP